jgi:hypothetical protein
LCIFRMTIIALGWFDLWGYRYADRSTGADCWFWASSFWNTDCEPTYIG